MKLKQIFLSLFCIFLLMLNNIVLAENNTHIINGWIYDNTTNKIVGYNGDSADVIIPENSVIDKNFKFKSGGLYSEVSGKFKTVRKFVVSKGVEIEGDLGLSAYSGLTDLEFYNTADQMPKASIYLSDSERLEKLILPNGLQEIEPSMCYNCTSLKELYIPDSVKKIGKEAFSNCKSLTELILPNSVEYIGEKAFDGCNSIKSLYLPEKADYTSLYAPYELEAIDFEGTPIHTADFYRHFLNTKWFENSVVLSVKGNFMIVDECLFKYLGNDKIVTVPDGVKVIEAGAFKDTSVEQIILPDSLTLIDVMAFAVCENLREIVIPKSVERINSFAFSECKALKKVVINGNPIMEDNVFEYCSSLIDENITINGDIQYVVSVTGEESNPFAFTETSYNKDWVNADNTVHASPIHNETIKPTNEPQQPNEPTAEPKATAKPVETETPQAILEPQTLSVHGGDKIGVSVNDKEVTFPDAQPFIDDNDRTQIPIRAVADMLDCKVDWDKDTRTVTITSDNGGVVILTIDSSIMNVNDNTIQMDTTAIIKDDRTYIPVRFVAETMGLTVEWHK